MTYPSGDCAPTQPERTFCLGLVAVALLVLLAARAFAVPPPDPSAQCEDAAVAASRTTGVPLSVLKAISLAETGRKKDGRFRPWPWTVNMEGEGVWFETEDAAREYSIRHYKAGARSFDVGCFQINFRWHGSAFSSIDEMFDPNANAIYAARFLAGLRDELGSWSAAAGAYHSRTPEYAKRYAARFDALRQSLLGNESANAASSEPVPADTAAPEQSSRKNEFPLLVLGVAGQMGSLVPIRPGGSQRRLIGSDEPQG